MLKTKNTMNKKIRYIALAAAFAAMGFSSCDDILEEEPRGIFTPDFLRTNQGIEHGLIGLYQNLRYVYGNMYYYNSLETGTDEYTYAESADGNFKDADLSGAGTLTPSSSRSDVLWSNAYASINSANFIIKYGTEANLDKALLAEAYFFRAFNYFCLVQTFGGVSLDLGCGEFEPNIKSVRKSVRNTVPEVYSKAIFSDLKFAIENLPDNPRLQGTATKNLAKFFLAKAYLTFGWWLENPKNIPTYPQCSRTDLDGHDAAWYFQQAQEVATSVIENPGPYGLMETYYDVNLGANDRNKECMFYADRTESDEFYNGGNLSYAGGSGTEQTTVWAPTWNYCNIRTFKTPDGSILNDKNEETNTIDPCKREASQWGGRPWTRMAPVQEVFQVFDNKAIDSRYDGTFVTVYRGNWAKGGDPAKTYYNANLLPIQNGEPVLSFVPEQLETSVKYPTAGYGYNNVCAGETEGRADWIIEPDHINRLSYPGLWKLGTYRTDNGNGLGQPNGALTRPFYIAKFSEIYLIAAEAAVKSGDQSSARDFINVLRARAGKWRFSNAENKVVEADFSEELVDATPSEITIDYILDERMRELFGEGIRWYDLARTQTWEERAGEYTTCEKNANGTWSERKTITRNIQPFNYLRPIPIGQLNSMEMSETDIAAYQNPGYN